MRTLVYPGSGYDIEILFTEPELNGFDEYILVDTLPKHPHYRPGQPGYEPTRSKRNFYNTLCDEFCAQSDTGIKAKVWTWQGEKFKVYCNTGDFEMKLDKGKDYSLFIRGYRPNDVFLDSTDWKHIYQANDSMLLSRYRNCSTILEVCDCFDDLVWDDDSDFDSE